MMVRRERLFWAYFVQAMRSRPSGLWAYYSGWWPSFGKKIQTSRFIFELIPATAVRHCMPWHDAWEVSMPSGSPRTSGYRQRSKRSKNTSRGKALSIKSSIGGTSRADGGERVLAVFSTCGVLSPIYQAAPRKSIKMFMFKEDRLVKTGLKKSTIGVLLHGCPTIISGRTLVDGCSASWPTR